MKKLLFSIVSLCLVMVAKAQNELVVATLQHEDAVSVFTGVGALASAHEAAADGDIITLSAGVFNATTITKSVAIYGAGFEENSETNTAVTKINGQLYLGAEGGETLTGVHLEGIYFNTHVSKNVALENFEMRACYVNGTLTIGANTNTIIKNCVITGAIAGASLVANNCLIENCWVGNDINSFAANSSVNINHCIVGGYVGPYLCQNSIFPYYWVGAYYDRAVFANTEGATVYNCIFRSFEYNNKDKNTFINCYAVDFRDIFTDAENANYSETRTFEIKNPETWIATDETEIGIRPGWSKVPGIPVVNSLQLNVEGKTLNVTYDAKVR